MAAIECRDVHRHFKDVRAVDGVNLTVEAHQIFGLLGPNGSGKTTLLNVLQGLDRPTSGTVSVLGLDPIAQHDVLVERMGTQLQESTIIPRLTVREALRTFASFYPRTRDVDELLAGLGLAATAGARVVGRGCLAVGVGGGARRDSCGVRGAGDVALPLGPGNVGARGVG